MSSQATCKCDIFPPKEGAKNKKITIIKIVSAASNILANTQYS